MHQTKYKLSGLLARAVIESAERCPPLALSGHSVWRIWCRFRG